MEKELFDYTDFKDGGEDFRQFLNCVLIQKIGDYQPGCRFAFIVISIPDKRMELYHHIDDLKPLATYKLTYQVGQKL